MSRRSDHSREELRELIISSAIEIVMTRGYDKFSARELALKINYSAGTIYNIFVNLNELIVHVEIEILQNIEEKLSHNYVEGCVEEKLSQFSKRYLDYILEYYNLWALLINDKKDPNIKYPTAYLQKYSSIISLVETILHPVFPNEEDRVLRQRYALLFWKGLNGILLFSGSHKLAFSEESDMKDDVTFWVNNFVKSLKKDYVNC